MELSKDDLMIIARLQGFGRLTITQIANLQFSGSTIKAKRRVQRLLELGYVQVVGVNYFSYTGKEVSSFCSIM